MNTRAVESYNDMKVMCYIKFHIPVAMFVLVNGTSFAIRKKPSDASGVPLENQTESGEYAGAANGSPFILLRNST